jgi:hypothetical protein
MASDRTRTSDDLRQGYCAVDFQQGRVTVDRDFNALQEIAADGRRAEVLDVVGPSGTPDDGFLIDFAAAAPGDFVIQAGTMYLGGLRVAFEPPGQGQPPIGYFNQPDWLFPDLPARTGAGRELVFLHVRELVVSGREDDDLLDRALGGPDTAARRRRLVRVRRLPVAATADCQAAWAQAQDAWQDQGYAFDPATMRLMPTATLQVGVPAPPGPPDPCEPAAQGGYLGADNQLIRVRLTGPDSLVWGYDNASFLYKVDAVAADHRTLTISPPPVDATRYPRAGQAVEVLRSAARLDNGRYAAEADGIVTTLLGGYDASGQVVLTNDLPPEYRPLDQTGNPLYLRIWKARAEGFVSGSAVPLDPTGLEVSPTTQGQPAGDFWMIAVRPSEPPQIYPDRFLAGPQPPDGPRQWACPLAVIEWDAAGAGQRVADCRVHFDNLAALTARGAGGCCTVTLRPQDVTAASPLQAALDRAQSQAAGALRVCLGAGTYILDQPLRLAKAFTGLTLEGCGGTVTLRGAKNASALFLDGLIVLTDAADVTLRGLDLVPPAVPLLPALQKRKVPAATRNALGRAAAQLRATIAVRAARCRGLTIEDCRVEYLLPEAANGFGTGLYASGDCTGLSVRRCTFRSVRPSPAPESTVHLAQSKKQLQTLGEAIVLFAQQTNGPPSDLSKLVSSKFLQADDLLNPPPGTMPPPFDPSDPQGWIDRYGNYVYLKPPEVVAVQRIVAYAKFDPGAAHVVLLFQDGSVKVATNDAAARALIRAAGGLTVGHAPFRSGPLRALFGVLVVPIAVTASRGRQSLRLPPVLHEAEFAGNRFVGLTVAAWSVGLTGAVQVRDEAAADCQGGYWLTPIASTQGTVTTFLPRLPLGQFGLDSPEMVLADLAVRAYPPPGDFNPSGPAPDPPPLAVRVAGNDLNVRRPDGAPTGPALLIQAEESQRADPDGAIMAVGGNRLSSHSPAIPTVALFGADRVTVNDNVIANDGPSGIQGTTGGQGLAAPSLELVPASSSAAPGDAVAVTGNVLRGRSNLGDLKRSLAPPFDTWQSYNSET